MSQTTVTQYGPEGFAGLLADLDDANTSSFSAETAVGFGAVVALGTNKARQVIPVSTAIGQAALAIGIATASHVVEQTATGVAQFAANQTLSVLKRGRIWVLTDDAVIAGSIANLKLSSGRLTDEVVAIGIEAFTQFTARFITGTTVAGLAIVEIK